LVRARGNELAAFCGQRIWVCAVALGISGWFNPLWFDSRQKYR
jgi:hypothetical protein